MNSASHLNKAFWGVVVSLFVWCWHPCIADDSPCPCIDPWSDTSSLGSYYDSSTNQLRTDSGQYLPIDFGASDCKAHGEGTTIECSGTDNPDYCSGLWCYVDTNNCLRPHHQSTFFSGLAVHYSYETCGNLDSYTSARLLLELKGRTLRIGVPTNAINQHFIYWEEDGTPAGATVSFFTRLLSHHRIPWYFVGISQGSLDRYTWPYSACVHDVALNRTDLCIGDFWPLPERLQMTTFAHTLEFEPLHLISFRKDNETETFMSLISRPFVPYTMEVWFTIFACVLGYALLFWFVEGLSNDEDFPHKGFLNAFGRGLYLSVNSFLSAAACVNPVLPAGRLLNVAFGIFILLTISTYTANLASFFVRKKTGSAAVESIEDAIERRITVCGGDLIKGRILADYSELALLFKAVDMGPNAVDYMDDGTCDAVIIEKKTWEAVVRGFYHPDSPRKHCNKIMLSQPLTHFAITSPVREEIEKPISWAVADAIQRGWWRQAEASAFDTFYGEQGPLCKQIVVGALDGTRDPESTALTLTEMGGTFILSGLVAALALLVFFLELLRQRRLREIAGELRSAGFLSRSESFNPAEEDDEYKGTEGGNMKQQVAACLTFCKAMYDSMVEEGKINQTNALRRQNAGVRRLCTPTPHKIIDPQESFHWKDIHSEPSVEGGRGPDLQMQFQNSAGSASATDKLSRHVDHLKQKVDAPPDREKETRVLRGVDERERESHVPSQRERANSSSVDNGGEDLREAGRRGRGGGKVSTGLKNRSESVGVMRMRKAGKEVESQSGRIRIAEAHPSFSSSGHLRQSDSTHQFDGRGGPTNHSDEDRGALRTDGNPFSVHRHPQGQDNISSRPFRDIQPDSPPSVCGSHPEGSNRPIGPQWHPPEPSAPSSHGEIEEEVLETLRHIGKKSWKEMLDMEES